ncbi:hypothetical protein [Pseudomonas sp. CGJS7]|uniref:hypothetical protein n=1 Tax=Pseudomonas sp. CGJS7 TaxID=3109348 RepID=UPI0030089630
MQTWWPWLAVAALGALHGANPANGWMFAAARGLRAGDDAQARRALWPIAVGHAVSVAMVVLAVAQGVLLDRVQAERLAGAVLIAMALYRGVRRAWPRLRAPRLPAFADARAGQAGLALWSCLMATAHGAGLMLVPALVPLCMADTPAREIVASGSLLLALAAVGVHLAVMLIVTGVLATGVCRGAAAHAGRIERMGHRFGGAFASIASRDAWTVVLALMGLGLIAFE